MGWFVRDRRGISWRDQTLDSLSAPPAPLVVVFGLVVLLMFLASYSDYRAHVERTRIGARLLLVLVPVVLVLLVHVLMANRWFYMRLSSPSREMLRGDGGGGSPWVLAVWVVLLLVLVHYHSSFQSSWFRTF